MPRPSRYTVQQLSICQMGFGDVIVEQDIKLVDRVQDLKPGVWIFDAIASTNKYLAFIISCIHSNCISTKVCLCETT